MRAADGGGLGVLGPRGAAMVCRAVRNSRRLGAAVRTSSRTDSTFSSVRARLSSVAAQHRTSAQSGSCDSNEQPGAPLSLGDSEKHAQMLEAQARTQELPWRPDNHWQCSLAREACTAREATWWPAPRTSSPRRPLTTCCAHSSRRGRRSGLSGHFARLPRALRTPARVRAAAARRRARPRRKVRHHLARFAAVETPER